MFRFLRCKEIIEIHKLYGKPIFITPKQKLNTKYYSKAMSKNKYDINYDKALEYWADIPPTIDGVLGGFGFISDVDINGSQIFLNSLFSDENPPSRIVAVDCGAGIGRITKHLLLPNFQSVDIVEPDEKFTNSIEDFVGGDNMKSKIGTIYKVGLQEFKPEKKYDVFWNQWVLGYLTDEDLTAYLVRCR